MATQAVRYAKFDYYGLTIYGEVWSLEELLKREQALGADDFELAWERDHFTHVYQKGFVYGKWHSVQEVSGEFGSNPANLLRFISKEQFEHAKGQGWKE